MDWLGFPKRALLSGPHYKRILCEQHVGPGCVFNTARLKPQASESDYGQQCMHLH